jgi:hypothetical protein
MIIIVESGTLPVKYDCQRFFILRLAAIYCAILAALIATDVVGSAVFFLLLDMVGNPVEHY